MVTPPATCSGSLGMRLGGRAGPAAERRLDGVESRRRAQVTYQRQHRTHGRHRLLVQGPQLLGRDLFQRLRHGQLDRVGMLAVEPGQQRLARQHGGLAAGDHELATHALALARHLMLRVGRRADDLGEQRQQLLEIRGQHRSDEGQPVAVDTGRRARAQHLQLDRELGCGRAPAVPASIVSASSGGRPPRAGLGAGLVFLAGWADGDAQPQLDNRHRSAADGEHPQPVGQQALSDCRDLQRRRGGDLAGSRFTRCTSVRISSAAGLDDQQAARLAPRMLAAADDSCAAGDIGERSAAAR